MLEAFVFLMPIQVRFCFGWYGNWYRTVLLTVPYGTVLLVSRFEMKTDCQTFFFFKYPVPYRTLEYGTVYTAQKLFQVQLYSTV